MDMFLWQRYQEKRGRWCWKNEVGLVGEVSWRMDWVAGVVGVGEQRHIRD